jgi:hypothetical protein
MAQQNNRRPETDLGRPSGFSAVLAASALALALWLAWGSANLFWRDLAFAAVRTEVGFWGRDDYQPTMSTRTTTEASLAALLTRAPAQPDYLTLAANLYAWQAYWAEQPALQRAYRLRSVRAQYAAQKSRPAHRQGWQKMIRYAADTEGAEPWLLLAERRLAALAASVRSRTASGRKPTGQVENSNNRVAN